MSLGRLLFPGRWLLFLLALATPPGFGQAPNAGDGAAPDVSVARYAGGQVLCRQLHAAVDRPGRRPGSAQPSGDDWKDLTTDLVVEVGHLLGYVQRRQGVNTLLARSLERPGQSD